MEDICVEELWKNNEKPSTWRHFMFLIPPSIDKFITDTVDTFNMIRLRGIILDLLPDMSHVAVYSSVRNRQIVGAPNFIQKFISAYNLSFFVDQKPKNLELQGS